MNKQIKIRYRGFYNRPCGRVHLLAENTILPVIKMCDVNKTDYICEVKKNAHGEDISGLVYVQEINAEVI